MPETRKYQNAERYSKYISSFKFSKSFIEKNHQNINFIPKPIKDEIELEYEKLNII
jgi:hypothetical protein